MPTYLIVGASGFLGLNLVEALLAQGHRVVGLDRDDPPAAARSAFARLPGVFTAGRIDLAGIEISALVDFFRAHGVTHVINAAAITPGPTTGPERAAAVFDVNVVAAMALMEAAAASGVRGFLQPSSASVYGDAVFEGPAREDGPARPRVLYGFSKYAVERLALQFARERGLDLVCTRIGAVFGPWEHDTGVRDLLSPPFQIARLAAAGGEAVLAPAGRRDWCHAPEVAAALLALLAAPRRPFPLYNVSCGAAWHLETLCRAMAAEFPAFRWRLAQPGEAPNIAYYEDPAAGRHPLDVSRLSAFGFRFGDPAAACAAYARWCAAALAPA